MRSPSGQLQVIDAIAHRTSPRLGIRFDLSGDTLQIVCPNGQKDILEIPKAMERPLNPPILGDL